MAMEANSSPAITTLNQNGGFQVAYNAELGELATASPTLTPATSS